MTAEQRLPEFDTVETISPAPAALEPTKDVGCGPGSADCSQVLRDVWLFLDDEMDQERRALVQHHLDECSPCLAEAGLEAKLKALLRTKCGGERAPQSLRERLTTQFATVHVAADGTVLVSSTVVTTVEQPG